MTEREEMYKDMFPDEWLCPWCMVTTGEAVKIPNDIILEHATHEHRDYIGKTATWEQFYNRMMCFGGV